MLSRRQLRNLKRYRAGKLNKVRDDQELIRLGMVEHYAITGPGWYRTEFRISQAGWDAIQGARK